MKLGQISSAKFPPKLHIASGTAALKPAAGRKRLGCLYHATDARPDASTLLNRGLGIVQVCKNTKPAAPVAAWATVATPDLVGMITLDVGQTTTVDAAMVPQLVVARLKSTSIVKYWVTTPNTPGFLTCTVVPATSIVFVSTAAETSFVYIEITY